jgi:small nuclear ribonucleoprotein F
LFSALGDRCSTDGETVKLETNTAGVPQSIDSYMNIQLSNTEEFIDRKFTGALGQVLIRCNNVLYVTAADGKGGEGGDRDTKMEG